MKKKKKYTQPVKKTARIVSVLLYIALYLLCACCAVLFSTPPKLSFEPGKPCEETVTATRDIEDKYSTELQRQEIMQKVAPVYKVDAAIAEESLNKLASAFDAMEQARATAKQIYLTRTTSYTVTFVPGEIDWETALSEPDMNTLRALVPEYISQQNIYTAASMEQKALASLREAATERAKRLLEDGILEDELESAAESIRYGLAAGGVFSNAEADLAHSIALQSITANKTFDNEATEAAKAAAAEQVETIVYKKGQTIVQMGEILKEYQYELIKELGLASDNSSTTPRVLATMLLLAAVFIVWIMYAIISDKRLIESVKLSLCIFVLTALGVAIAIVCKRVDARLIPTYLLAIVGAAFLRRRTAIVYSCFSALVLTAILAPVDGFFFSEQIPAVLLSSLLGSAAAVLALNRKQSRGEYIYAGIVAGLLNALVYISMSVFNGEGIERVGIYAAFGVVNGLFCGLLSVGVLPIWEAMFSLATPTKLLEMSNPGNELLKRLMVEAPGTYHHSIMVANLAEAGAEIIGGDALLARVAAYYHDVGKLYNPKMFKENQMGAANPHDDMAPQESAAAIIEHIEQGVALGERYKLPKSVRYILQEHHGDSLASFFYYKARQQGAEPDEKDFRYPGPRPQTRESGVVMLADTVEAAVRANSDTAKDESALREIIYKLIKGKYDDGQLDECPLNRRDLKNIMDAFIYVFEGASHERIKYPDPAEREDL